MPQGKKGKLGLDRGSINFPLFAPHTATREEVIR
jgi:hypothetical protein